MPRGLPLIIEREDADQLSTIRSRNCFVLAATQGLASLDERVGLRRRCAILLNFNTLVFMRTREQETGEFATVTLGNREQPPAPKPKEAWEDSVVKVLSTRSDSKWQDKRVAPPGALGRLQPHQAYVVKSDGSRFQSPLWFAPWFDMEPVSPPVIQTSPNRKFSATHVEQLLRRHGIAQVLSKETQGFFEIHGRARVERRVRAAHPRGTNHHRDCSCARVRAGSGAHRQRAIARQVGVQENHIRLGFRCPLQRLGARGGGNRCESAAAQHPAQGADDFRFGLGHQDQREILLRPFTR